MLSVSAPTFEPSLPPQKIVFGSSPAMLALSESIDKLASSGLPVLIQGESGAGKEVLARSIHQRRMEGQGEFLRVDCAALTAGDPGEMLAAESGVGGTLFLDEVAALGNEWQGRLLQILKQNERHEGAMRVICSTSCDLQKEIDDGRFRQELFFRINVLTLRLPPLRERREDVPALFGYFLDVCGLEFGLRPRPVSAALMRSLTEYRWPGNIRELENLVKRYVVMGSEETIASALHYLPADTAPEVVVNGPVALKKLTRQMVRQLERQVILQSLHAHNWNRKRVARALNISYRALLYKIRDAGLGPNRGLAVVPPPEAAGLEEKAA